MKYQCCVCGKIFDDGVSCIEHEARCKIENVSAEHIREQWEIQWKMYSENPINLEF